LAEELEKQNGVFHDLEGEMKVKGETLERQVSDRSERALKKTSILAMDPANWLQT